MICNLVAPVSAASLARVLGLECHGADVYVTEISPLAHIASGRLSFSVSPLEAAPEGSLVIAPALAGTTSWLVSRSPRLDFIRALHWLRGQHLLPKPGPGHIDPEACVHRQAVVDVGAVIGPGCIIGPCAHVRAHVELGCRVRVGNSTVIGHDGFGYERDGRGCPLRFPHLGRVVVEDDVDIGNLCCIARGALEETHIGKNVKIDDQAYIAHHVTVGAGTLVMSGVRLNGRARVGEGCWIGTGALVREGCSIGDRAVVGMGSVVVRDVSPETTVMGNPAREKA